MSVSGDTNAAYLYASADSLLGQLQRGRGMGFLRALQELAAVVEPLLFDCVIHDPRWDRQLEERSDYYAELLLQLALPLDRFEVSLHAYAEDGSEEAGYAESVVLDTLSVLAVRGEESALAIVRAYQLYGRHWNTAFETLMELPTTSFTSDEMSHIIDQRFSDDDTLADELTLIEPDMSTQHEPWRSLCLANQRMNRLLTIREQEQERYQHQQDQVQARFAGLSPTALFSTPDLAAQDADGFTAYRVARSLQTNVTIADLDLLLDVAQHGERWQRVVAFRGLQRLADPASLPVLQAFFESSDAQPGSLYGAAVRAMVALPPAVTLALARDWFDAPDGLHRHIALLILEAHATATDADRVHAALLPSLERDTRRTGECYMQCSMLEILAQFPEARFYATAETMFKEAKYARTRIYAARTLIACDRDKFVHDTALECLWDCEQRVRLIGCSSVALSDPEAVSRLQAMASDPHQDGEVRNAARERLAH